MREILFRGKRIDNGEWVEGKNIFWDTENRVNIVPTGELCFLATHHETLQKVLILPRVEVDPRTVGQYTGLTDKNGTKIFDGDCVRVVLVRDMGVGTSTREEIGVISYDNLGMVGLIKYLYNDIPVWSDIFQELSLSCCIEDCYFEVIGNIHDNPESLKGGEV